MIFSIDLTESFGAIDFDSAGGIKTYINILPSENPFREFQLVISNFLLNLIDKPIISALSKQDSTFLEKMTEDGFLIISEATLTFKAIKGYEKLIRLSDQLEGYIVNESYGQNLNNGDTIYDISGIIAPNPESIINLAIISPDSIKLEFDQKKHTYLENYENLQKSLATLNSVARPVQPSISKLFQASFSNMYTSSNFDAGYRIYQKHN